MGQMYLYTPLTGSFSIRLLLLQPAAALDEAIRCSLVETPLDSALEYSALSYTWDGQSPSCPIECDDGELNVTPNCWAALRRLRDKQELRNLWIDGICIDQTSVQERNQQVALMGDIYKRAQTVTVWLGEGDDGVENAIIQLREIGYLHDKKPINEEQRKEMTDVLALVFDSRLSSSKGILEPVFELSWFYRMWTVQEVTLPNVESIMVQYGSISFSWLYLLLAMNLLKITEFKWGKWNEATLLQRSIATLIVEKRDPSWAGLFGVESSATQSYRSLLGLLAGMRPKKATDPRDKTFALYAVANELGFALPLPDYEKSLEQTYTDTAIACIEQDNNPKILYEAPSDKRIPGLPSWVPDWSDEEAIYTYSAEYINKGFKAGGVHDAQWSLKNGNRLLALWGSLVDSIDACGPVLKFDKTFLDGREMTGRGGGSLAPFQQELANAVNTMKEWVNLASLCSSYPTGEPVDDALRSCLMEVGSTFDPNRPHDGSWETWIQFMRMNHEQFLESLSTRAHHESGYDKTGEHFKAGKTFSPFLTFLGIATSFKDTSAWEYNNTVIKQATGKCFFRTKNGYFGLAIRPVNVGDEIVLLKGFEIPFIVRKFGEEYELVASKEMTAAVLFWFNIFSNLPSTEVSTQQLDIAKMTPKSALKVFKDRSNPNSPKTVTFAPLNTMEVREYPREMDTWYSGESARYPTDWELDNQDKLTEETFALIEAQERDEATHLLKNKPLPMNPPQLQTARPLLTADNLGRAGIHRQGNNRRRGTIAVRRAAPNRDNTTFEGILSKENFSIDELSGVKPRTSSLTSINSIASIKSLSKMFKRKVDGKRTKRGL
ncbi:hypothetical protein N0V90_005922 [Kalmusia sp. IMI 367209]|nr:hypothetical protein N0V90_005922 [Kalmusia sp. IMI 367209]